MGEFLRTTGGEFGVNTGRPRRCGWYDAVLARQAVRINGFTDPFITKLDVLTGLDKIPGLRGLRRDGVRHDEMPMTPDRVPPTLSRFSSTTTAGPRTFRM